MTEEYEFDNSTDPVEDDRFPLIVAFDPVMDAPRSEDHGGCITKTIEEVNPDGN